MKGDEETDRDISDVIKQERSRGKRVRVDPDLVRQRKSIEHDYLQVLKDCGSEKDLREVLNALGLQEGTARFQTAIDAWREMKRIRAQQPRGRP